MNDIQIISGCKNETVAELIDLIGVKHTITIVKAFSGTQIYIPKFKNLAKEYRDLEIYKDYKMGISYHALSIKYELTETTIRNIIAEKKKNESN